MSVIQFSEPVVKHTTVTVQNVLIGKRQLTQRVFRQILHAPIFGEEPNSLRGEVWGFVNYFWKEDNDYRNSPKYSRHILWINKNSELRRTLITKDLEYWENDKYKHAATYLLTRIPQLYIAV